MRWACRSACSDRSLSGGSRSLKQGTKNSSTVPSRSGNVFIFHLDGIGRGDLSGLQRRFRVVEVFHADPRTSTAVADGMVAHDHRSPLHELSVALVVVFAVLSSVLVRADNACELHGWALSLIHI